MIFRGTFEHALDAKHRLTVPSKFRAALAGGVVLAASPEVDAGLAAVRLDLDARRLRVVHDTDAGGLNPSEPKARELKRFFFNSSFDAELDSANRLMIPPPLMRYARLDKEVVVTGSGECIEVWDRKAYDAYHDDILNRIPDIAASLGHTA